mmetsp:Transcript_51434/g.122274  ORF Transcript_51434/g.122274 Transcript_51434/m.122274 type:complete len:210 (+) Transcript_51434:895-1524(+)
MREVLVRLVAAAPLHKSFEGILVALGCDDIQEAAWGGRLKDILAQQEDSKLLVTRLNLIVIGKLHNRIAHAGKKVVRGCTMLLRHLCLELRSYAGFGFFLEDDQGEADQNLEENHGQAERGTPFVWQKGRCHDVEDRITDVKWTKKTIVLRSYGHPELHKHQSEQPGLIPLRVASWPQHQQCLPSEDAGEAEPEVITAEFIPPHIEVGN